MAFFNKNVARMILSKHYGVHTLCSINIAGYVSKYKKKVFVLRLGGDTRDVHLT